MNIPNDYFIFINIFVGIIYLSFIIIGYKKGFLFELISLLYTVISTLIAWFLSPVLSSLYPLVNLSSINSEAELISKFMNLDVILNTIVYFIIIFLILKLFYLILALILKGINKMPLIGKFNQILGLFMGVVNATIITLVLSMVLSLPVIKNGNEIKNNTVFKYVSNYSENILTYVVNNIDLDNIKQQFTDFDVNSARESFKQWLEYNNSNE